MAWMLVKEPETYKFVPLTARSNTVAVSLIFASHAGSAAPVPPGDSLASQQRFCPPILVKGPAAKTSFALTTSFQTTPFGLGFQMGSTPPLPMALSLAMLWGP